MLKHLVTRLFGELINSKLRLIDYPQEFGLCSNTHCNNIAHRLTLDKMYANIVSILSNAAVQSQVDTRSNRHSGRVVGWNKHVGGAHARARIKYQLWLWCHKPMAGEVYNDMCLTRKIFKSKLRWCQNHQEQIKLDIIASHCKANNFQKILEGDQKVRC